MDVSTGTSKALPGDDVVFTVTVENITAEGGLIGVDVPFQFDTSAFAFVALEYKLPAVWETAYYAGWTQAKNGLIWLRALDDGDSFTKGTSSNGSIEFTVTLRVIDNAVCGKDYTVKVADVASGKVCGVAGDGKCSGVVGAGDSVKVNVVEEVTMLRGDVNLDGKVTPLDASLALQHDARLITLTETQKQAADVNLDGNVSPLDASLILQFNAKLITWEELDAR